MVNEKVYSELKSIVEEVDFYDKCVDLTERWSIENIGIDSVEAILKIMEENAHVDFGMPGPLVHYVENFYKKGYEPILVESVSNAPTKHTLWMLNRLINGTKDPDQREAYIMVLKSSVIIADDPGVIESAKHFIEVQKKIIK